MELAFQPLKAEDVEVRVGTCSEKGASLLLYKDSRCDMRALDAAVGPMGWQRKHEFKDGKLYCSVGIRDDDGGWVWKEDVGTESNMEAAKGEASDSFKRACVNWGIGRELYTAPFVWVPADKLARHRKNERSGKWGCWDEFYVGEMAVEDGRIVKLTICNRSRKGEVVYGNGAAKAQTPEPKRGRFDRIKQLKAECLSLGVKEEGIREWLEASFDRPMKDFTAADIKATEEHLKALVDSARELGR